MAFFWGRFDPIETVDSEVTELYRIRDNDEKYKNNKALLVNTSSLHNFVIDNYKISGERVTRKPTDQIWLSMTEEERVENGLPTRLSLTQNSIFGFSIFLIWAAVGTVLYSHAYYPGGIVLRNQRKERIPSYL